MKRMKLLIFAAAHVIMGLVVLVAVPSLKFRIYRRLPVSLRFRISSVMSDKFLVGMVFFVEDKGRLMLVRHTYQDRWDLPGGWLEHGESIEDGARREIREEFGIEADDAKILKMNAVKSKPVIDVALSLHLLGTPRADQLEVRRIKFFPLDALPEDILRTHKPYIEESLGGESNLA